MMPQQQEPFNVPISPNTVTVRVIDTTAEVTLGIDDILRPRIKGHTELSCPCYAFLVEHESSSRKVLFDLGVRKDWEQMPSSTVNAVKQYGWQVKVEKDVPQILEEHGYRREKIETVIWSHYHWDHLGNPALFPPWTAVVVGPGFKDKFYPGGKAIPDSPIKDEYTDGRALREIGPEDFTLNLAGFGAFDYFGDGSFYLLDTPGHTIGHLCGLARTTADTFIFMGADIAHHCGEFRPSAHLQLPSEILPNPVNPSSPVPCPGSLFTAIHPQGRSDSPFYHIGTWPNGATGAEDLEKAVDSLEKLEVYDAQKARVFVILAHDPDVRDVIDFFPRAANEWKEKGWAEKARWVFLRDFKGAVQS